MNDRITSVFYRIYVYCFFFLVIYVYDAKNLFSLLSLSLVLQNLSIFSFENAVDPDPLSSEEAICPGFTLFFRQPWIPVTYGPRREKTCLRGFANNTGADHPAHTRSLISAFVIRVLESTIAKLATSEISFSS